MRALYQQAGLDLNADLQTLNAASRISAKPSSLTYLEQAIDLYKPARVPVLTVHTEADGLVAVQDESAYRAINGPAGPYLRQVYVRRAGHCAFTAPEMLAAMQALLRRVDTQVWSGLTPAELNSAANRILATRTASSRRHSITSRQQRSCVPSTAIRNKKNPTHPFRLNGWD